MAEAVSGLVSQDVAAETFNTKMKDFTDRIRENEYRGQAVYFLNAFWNEIGDKPAKDVDGNKATKQVKIVEKTGVRYEDTVLTWPSQIYEWTKLMEKLSEDSKGSDMHALDESGGARFLEIEKRAKTVLARRAMLKAVDIDCDNHMSLFEWLLACEQLFEHTNFQGTAMSIQQRFHELMSRPQGKNEALEKAQQALDEVLAEIAKIEAKLEKLFATVETGGGVKKLRAHNEIDQINNNFPNVVMNRKLISAQAAVRKATKGGADGRPGVLPGANWWLNYELEIAKKYKPRKS